MDTLSMMTFAFSCSSWRSPDAEDLGLLPDDVLLVLDTLGPLPTPY